MSRLPLLLLPGLGCDERLWRHQEAALSRAGADVHVCDLSVSLSMEGLAADVLDAAPADRFALAGLSMGGIVALEIFRQARARVAGLALLDTTPHPEHAERSQQREENQKRVRKGELEQVLREVLAPSYFSVRHAQDATLSQLVVDMGLALGAEVFQRQWRALSCRPGSVPTLADIRVPTLVLCGREDKLCPVEVHELMAREIPAAHLVVLDNCGHLSPLESPEAVNRELAAWIKRCQLAQGQNAR